MAGAEYAVAEEPVGTGVDQASGTSIDVTEDAIMDALGTFLVSILPRDVDVIRGQVNRVPQPRGNYVVMTPQSRMRLAISSDEWDIADPSPSVIAVRQSTQITVQLDVYGPQGADNAQIIATLFWDDIGCAAIDRRVFQPLYATDGQQMPLVNGEEQYEDRWTMQAVLQANLTVSTPAQFAANVDAMIDAIGSPNP